MNIEHIIQTPSTLQTITFNNIPELGTYYEIYLDYMPNKL